MANILIVEDEEMVARMYQKALTLAGFNVEVIIGGKNAINLLNKKYSYDLILLDIMMPGIDGIEVLKNIRANLKTRHIPTIFLTNLSSSQSYEHELIKEANDYWVKTDININELGNKIQAFLNEKH